MGQVICSCDNPAFANLGRPNCVIEMKAVAFPIIVPRFKADGTRNTIDLTSATLGADIKALIQTSTALMERLYPFPRMENITFERTETVYETAPSTRKYKIDGVGGVRTFKGELWAEEAVHQLLRELNKIGCSDVDVFLPTIDGNLWGIKDNPSDTIIRGYEMATNTFDSFKEYATDTTTQKIMVSFDFDNAECEENSYAILAEEMTSTGGVKSTSLEGLISGTSTSVGVTTTTSVVTVVSGFGSAVNTDAIIGLATGQFALTNTTTSNVVTITNFVESTPGVYTLTYVAQTTNDVLSVVISGVAGYDISSSTHLAL